MELTAVLNNGQGPQQNSITKFCRLVVRLPEKTTDARIVVLSSHGGDGETRTLPVRAHDAWVNAVPPLPALGGVL